MMRWSIFVRRSAHGLKNENGRDVRRDSRRLEARVEALEGRHLLTGGSVVQNGALAIITPAATGPNVAIVSYQSHNAVKMLDVNLNGADNYFSLSQVAFVYYEGSGIAGSQTFEDSTSLHTVAWGGSGSNLFQGGSGQDEFFGGSGSNTFDAGSGFDVFVGGTGANVFNENASGSGDIFEVGIQNTINVPQGSTGHYAIS